MRDLIPFKINNLNDPIVFIDDEEDDLFLFKRAASKSKLTNPIITFYAVDEFFNYMDDTQRGVKELPALIFIDINMPKYSGLEILKRLKTHYTLNPFPKIIILSTSNFSKDKDRAFEYGCDAFIVKPDEPQKLVEALNRLAES